MPEEINNADLNDDEKKLLEELLSCDVGDLSALGLNRRSFLKQITAITGGILAAQIVGDHIYAQPINHYQLPGTLPSDIDNLVDVAFNVNHTPAALKLDPRMTLLDALREKLHLTGSKKGCDHGQCGACTVIVDGRRVLSCLTLAATCQSKNITSIEGIAENDQLHPIQTTFIKHDGFQCGYCTPGQICSAVALLDEVKKGEASYVTENLMDIAENLQLSDEEIRERMSGNICRCGAYPNIVAAIKEVLTGHQIQQVWQFS